MTSFRKYKGLINLLLVAASVFISFAGMAQTNVYTFGTGAGASNTTGDRNVYVGDSAAANQTTGSDNVAVGFRAGFNNTGFTSESKENVWLGTDAGYRSYAGDENVAIGHQAMYSCTTCTDMTFIGWKAGYSELSSQDNTFIGHFAGYHNSVGGAAGVDNLFAGEEAGYNNTNGDDNTFIGEDAGYNNTTGFNNTALGAGALRSNYTGNKNTAVGVEALYDCGGLTTRSGSEACFNTAVGDSAGTDLGLGTSNTFIGHGAGAGTEHADWNTFIGRYAGYNNNRNNATNTSDYNTSLGYLAGYINRSGEGIVAIGAFSYSNATNNERMTYVGANSDPDAGDVVLIGYDTYSDETGAIAIGNYASATGAFSQVIGYQANVAGDYSTGFGEVDIPANRAFGLGYLTEIDGDWSIGIGDGADIDGAAAIALGYQVEVSGDTAIAVGYETKVDTLFAIGIGASVNLTGINSIGIGPKVSITGDSTIAIGSSDSVSGKNAIVIGDGISITADNEVLFGNIATTSIGGHVNWTATSDGRIKKNVRENIPGLSFIRELRPVTYNFDIDKMQSFENGTAFSLEHNMDKATITYTGFIAQEVQSAAEGVGYDFSGIKIPKDESSQMYGLSYAEFVVPLVQSIKELETKNKLSDQKITYLENWVEKLETAIDANAKLFSKR